VKGGERGERASENYVFSIKSTWLELTTYLSLLIFSTSYNIDWFISSCQAAASPCFC